MKHISLFSGGGGFDLAAEWVGWTNVVSCEIEAFQNRILEYYWPDAYHHRDIKTLTGDKIDKEISKKYGSNWEKDGVVISGGFPCQPFSQAGKRKGTEDNRYLWPEMFRIIKEVRPDWVVAENVAAITSMVFPSEAVKMGTQPNIFGEDNEIFEVRQEYVIHRILKDFESIGYNVQPFIIPAAAIGAPHKRDRIWIVANTESKQSEFIEPEQPKYCEQKQRKFRGSYSKTSIANPDSTGLQRGEKRRGTNKKRTNKEKFPARLFQPTWEKFPTQSPVCSGDDGFPTELDGITFSKWRQESLKTFGNAIVPQIAKVIFQSINHITYGSK